ncbi:hypothetical protein [Photobacterium indicum]|uniref:hypothetical protein n=1 Tax=Photobacterium indicum TaxID=81447 RepID=UPI003D107147
MRLISAVLVSVLLTTPATATAARWTDYAECSALARMAEYDSKIDSFRNKALVFYSGSSVTVEDTFYDIGFEVGKAIAVIIFSASDSEVTAKKMATGRYKALCEKYEN